MMLCNYANICFILSVASTFQESEKSREVEERLIKHQKQWMHVDTSVV